MYVGCGPLCDTQLIIDWRHFFIIWNTVSGREWAIHVAWGPLTLCFLIWIFLSKKKKILMILPDIRKNWSNYLKNKKFILSKKSLKLNLNFLKIIIGGCCRWLDHPSPRQPCALPPPWPDTPPYYGLAVSPWVAKSCRPRLTWPRSLQLFFLNFFLFLNINLFFFKQCKYNSCTYK